MALLGLAQAGAPSPAPTANWWSTAQTVLDVTPSGWTAESPAVIFAAAAGGEIDGYRCYADAWKAQGIRTLIPLMAGGITFEQRRSRWRQVNIIYEALRRAPAGNWRRPAQPISKIVFAGHSFGAYIALLAAGADSRIGSEQAGNCDAAGCRPLAAAGYVVISGQPAQSARAEPPFWFARDAFRNLAPNRLVIYGTKDFVPTDPCMTEGQPGAPACRGDAASPGSASRGALLKVVDGFTHGDFGCENPARVRPVQIEIGAWVLAVTGTAAR